MPGEVTGAAAFEQLVVDAMAVNVEREEGVAIAVGPVVPEVNHSAAVRVAAAGCVVLRMLRPFRLPESARPMDVVRAAFDEPKGVRVHVPAVHAFVARAGDDMKEVLDNAVGNKHLAVIIKRDAPRIGRSVRDDFKPVARRVEPPDAAIDSHAFVVRRAGSADL